MGAGFASLSKLRSKGSHHALAENGYTNASCNLHERRAAVCPSLSPGDARARCFPVRSRPFRSLFNCALPNETIRRYDIWFIAYGLHICSNSMVFVDAYLVSIENLRSVRI